MTLYEKIIGIYPELEKLPMAFISEIILQNDSDGTGDYIAKWEYSKPIPDSLKLGK